MSSPKIILYTNRGCPWAHRAHIALKESGVEYEEVTIDLTKPREPWYLEVNPVRDIINRLFATESPSPGPVRSIKSESVCTDCFPARPRP